LKLNPSVDFERKASISLPNRRWLKTSLKASRKKKNSGVDVGDGRKPSTFQRVQAHILSAFFEGSEPMPRSITPK